MASKSATSKSGAARTAEMSCTILSWVRQKDSEFADAIEQVCYDRALAPSVRTPQVTFLYPVDAAYRSEIVELAYGPKADDAVTMLESLTLPDVFARGTAFGERPAGNRLKVKFVVKEARDDSVTLAGGVRLTRDKSFRPLASREGRIDVWCLAEGRAPTSGDKYEAPVPRARIRGGAVGGAAQTRADCLSARAALAAATETAYLAALCAQRRNRDAPFADPYLDRVVSLLNHLKATSPDALERVLPSLDYCPAVSFYLIFEPFKTSGDMLVSDDDYAAWGGASVYTDAVAEYRAFFRTPLTAAPARGAVGAAIDACRQSFRPGVSLPDQVAALYARLASENAIGNVQPVLPAAAAAALGGCKKLWQDEFRFIIHAAVAKISGAFEVSQSDFIEDVVAFARLSMPGNDYQRELRLAKKCSVVAPRFEIAALGAFVNSSDFLYLPVAPEDAAEDWDGGAPEPSPEQMYNRNYHAQKCLDRTSMTRAAGISPQAMAELRLYAASRGGLPADVLALSGGRSA